MQNANRRASRFALHFTLCTLHFALCAFLAVLCVLAVHALSNAALAWPADGWNQISSDHAAIRFRPADRPLAERIVEDVEDGYRHVSANLGIASAPPFTVYLASTGEEFRALTAGAVPDWGVGCALPGRRAIVLRHPHGAPQDLRETVFHEVSHILLRGVTGDREVPVWFDEGVAMWNAAEWRWGQSYEMASAAAWGSLLPLREIDDVLTFASPKAQLAYAESFFAVSHLVRTAGPDAIARLLTDVQAGQSFDDAFSRTVGVPPATFETLWRKAAQERFGLVALLWNASDLWLGVTALFLLAYVATRLRNRRKVRQWEAEEGATRPLLKVYSSENDSFKVQSSKFKVHVQEPVNLNLEPSNLEPSNRDSRAMVIGVTGGLGAGKTSVCRLFAAFGAQVIDADQVGREVVEHPDVKEALIAAFGEDIVDEEGRLKRRLLGQRAFVDPASGERLNRIVWPPLLRKLWADVRTALQENPDRPVIVDAALLFEWGDLSGFDAVVVVTAGEEVRRARMMIRTGLSEAEVEARMRAQAPEAKKVRRADQVIVNDGTEEELRAQATEVWKKLTGKI